jgi:1-acyl-sn-glycerol-3-phosphate acyltransferase
MAVSRLLIDHLLDMLAWLVGHGLFRTVEVVGAERVPRDRPVIIVANHFNGLVDAVLLAVIVRGVPRFIAKSTLWRSLLLRPLLGLAGLVPVSRREDRDDRVDNFARLSAKHAADRLRRARIGARLSAKHAADRLRRARIGARPSAKHAAEPSALNPRSFERATQLLGDRATLAIFPEGTTHDRLELAQVRTGAARIALGARAAGVSGVVIVPIGLTFDDKLALRSRVLARVGDAIDVDTWATEVAGSDTPAASKRAASDAPVGAEHAAAAPVDGEPAAGRLLTESDRAAVRLLTDTIRSRLSDVTPRYRDVLDRAILNRAAEVRLRRDVDSPGRIIPLTRREALAQRVADAPADATNAVIAAQGAYQLRLDLVRLRDEQLMPPVQPRWLLRRALGLTAYLALLGVVVLAGIAVNALPTLLTAAAGRRPQAPASKGTVRVLTALVAFPLTWIIIAVALPITGVLPTTLAFLACPVSGGVAVGGLERAIALARAWAGWMGLRNARDLLGRIHEARAHVCDQVDATTGESR